MFKIALVGPTGVGKTSVLAAMCDEFEYELNQIGCEFKPIGVTKRNIIERRSELEGLGKGQKSVLTENVVIMGTAGSRQFDFELRIPVNRDGEQDLLIFPIRITDLPGAWYQGSDRGIEADKILTDSNCSFWVVDSTALMENSSDGKETGEFHNFINDPETIYNSYQRAFQDKYDYHTIVMVLVRSESYVQKIGKLYQKRIGWFEYCCKLCLPFLTNDRTKNLYDKLNRCYAQLLWKLYGQTNGIVAFACHVETVGNLFFHNFELNQGKPQAQFRRGTKPYTPKNGGLPLRIAIKQILEQEKIKTHQTITEKDTWGRWLYDVFIGHSDVKTSKEDLKAIETTLSYLTNKLQKDKYVSFNPESGGFIW
ncbi:MAG: ATP-binding protein [Planctomycetaceae bacterium]|jgi:GTPase SAR1 family protein|nr:ATP-binding protein [Planctomycetaceae bacterium]